MNFSAQKDKIYFGYFASIAGKGNKKGNKNLAYLPWCFNVDTWHQERLLANRTTECEKDMMTDTSSYLSNE